MPNPVDPSTLSDEELDKIIQDGVDPLEESEPTAEEDEGANPEPQAPEPNREDEPETDGEEEETPEEPVQQPSRREQLRVQQLISKFRNKAEDKPDRPVSSTALNYAEELDADPELIKRLEDDRQNARNESYKDTESLIRTSEWRTMLNMDAPQVEAKYAQLNPKDTEHFHPALADSLTQWYLSTTGFDSETRTVQNSDVRWSDFVDGIFEIADEIAATKVEASTKNIKRQAAQTALRPDGSSSKKMNLNKAPESMSDEELDAMIAQAIPPRR